MVESSGRMMSCNWVMPGKGEGGDTEQKSWEVEEEGGHRDNGKGQVTYPALLRGAMKDVHLMLAPPPLVSWRSQSCY